MPQICTGIILFSFLIFLFSYFLFLFWTLDNFFSSLDFLDQLNDKCFEGTRKHSASKVNTTAVVFDCNLVYFYFTIPQRRRL
jgi:hypothetical protein